MRIALIVFLSLIVAGCASTETVKKARGQGVSRVYAAPPDRVFDATLAAAKDRQLEVVEADRRAGRILLSHGVTWLSWGERIAVFLRAANPGSTEVEIVSKPVLAPLNFPPDWQQILLDRIGIELRAGR
ncbi:MAG: hypothetical protein OHK0026_12690 [Rhodocyclaceae bacterium]